MKSHNLLKGINVSKLLKELNKKEIKCIKKLNKKFNLHITIIKG